jgi:hypothetical protein
MYSCGGRKMAKVPEEITIELDVNMDKFQQKLRVIAKYMEQLADELDAIDKFTDDNELPSQLEGSD